MRNVSRMYGTSVPALSLNQNVIVSVYAIYKFIIAKCSLSDTPHTNTYVHSVQLADEMSVDVCS